MQKAETKIDISAAQPTICTPSQIAKKTLCYVGGMFLIAIGINISKAAGLGISPVSAVPYACELIWGIELGIASALVYMILIALQIIILRKKFKAVQLLQFVCTYVLSFFITLTSTKYFLMMWLPNPTNYIMRLVYCLMSIVIIGIGVSFYLMPKWIPLPAEGLATVIAQISKGKLQFHNAKILVDVSLVVISAILSLTFLNGLVTVREGTILAAILVGKVVGIVMKICRERTLAWINK